MNPLQKHVERLFSRYQQTAQIRELKEEILSNLEAKLADLTTGGMDYDEAVQSAISDIPSVDHLIEDNREIYVNRYRLELAQMALLYSLIFWIATIPLRLFGLSLLGFFMMLLVLATGVVYLAMNAAWRRNGLERTGRRSIHLAVRRAKLAWLIWGLFIAVSISTVTAIHFASNIWYLRPIQLEGPYQYALVGISYAKPFLTLLIPLMFQSSARLIRKNEVES